MYDYVYLDMYVMCVVGVLVLNHSAFSHSASRNSKLMLS